MSSSLKSQRKVRRIKSCVTCHQRKVRCDRQQPCGECASKSQACVYYGASTPSTALVLPALHRFVDRNVIEMNINKELDTYWQDFHRPGRVGPRPVTPSLLFHAAPGAYFPSNLLPSPQEAMELVWAGQATNVLHMFSTAAEMTMPYFQTFFSPQLSTAYWKLLTRPVHVDLTEGFDDPSWRQEQRAARNRLQQQGIFSISRSQTPPSSEDQSAAHPVYVDLSRPLDMLAPPSPTHSPNPALFEPSFAPDDQGLFQAPTGRRFDAMTDFLFLKSPRVEDIMNLLEYGVAFLRGSSFLGWTEVNNLISFNVERIVHTLVYRLRHELDINLADRLINCISIFANQREYGGHFESIAPYLMMGYHIATDHNLHLIDPENVSRILLTALYYTSDPKLRDEYEQIALTNFSHLTGIVLRTRFSYVSGALLTPDSEPEASSIDFWKKVERYLIEAELILPHLDSASDLPASSTILFKCIYAVLRAELGPRIGHHDWPIQQGCLIAKHLCTLEDHNTFIATGLLLRFRIHSRRSSVLFNLNGRQLLVSDYLAEQIRAIPTMPVVPIIPGEEPFNSDTSQILGTQFDTTSGQTMSARRHTGQNTGEPASGEDSLDSPAVADSSSTPSSSSATNHTTLTIDNSSPFRKDTGTPDTPIPKKDGTISKTIIGY